MKEGHATIRDIALKLDISISTVSRAIRNMPEVNPKTKREVLAMAKKLKYEPNVVAQSLRNSKTLTLGVIVPDLVPHFFASSISGMQNIASKKGYNIVICQSNETFDTEVKNIQTLISSRVDGLLISVSGETCNYDHFHSLYSRGIPLVFFDRVCEEINTTKIIVDDHNGAFKAAEHLILEGCKKIAFLSGPQHLSISKNRLQGYKEALQKYNIPLDEKLIFVTDLSEEDNRRQIKALLNLSSRPDGIIAINDPVAIQALYILQENGIHIPEEIALVGFTNEPASALVEPSLTTLSQPSFEIGQIAVQHILNQINNPESFIPQTIILNTDLIVRKSSRKKVDLQKNEPAAKRK
jgi:LacI family transcriptional regulator